MSHRVLICDDADCVMLIFKEWMLFGLDLMLSLEEIPRIAGSFETDISMKASLTSAVYTAQAAVNTTRKVVAAAAK